MPGFLHTADWQIGRQYGGFEPDDGAALAEARFEAVRRIAQLATDLRVDAVLVAGDVFDAQTVADKTIGRLFNALEGFGGWWVMIPGNHDAALVESVWQRAARFAAVPKNVRVIQQPGVYEFPDLGLALLAAPLTQRHTYEDLTAFFDHEVTSPGLLRIGLAHGCVQGVLPDDIDSANPIAASRAASARLDYLALGDWHGTKRIDEHTWYAGTPEQDRFKDNGAGHVLHVTLDSPGSEPHVVAHAVAQYRWQLWEEEISVTSDVDRLIERLRDVVAPDVISIRLRGQLDLAGRACMEEASRHARARARVLQLDATGLKMVPTEEDLAALQADGYLGEVVDALREQQGSDEGEVATEALILLAGLLNERRTEGGVA